MYVNSLDTLLKTAKRHPSVSSVLAVTEVIFLVATLLDVGIVREDTYRQTESVPSSSNSMRVLQNNIQSINTSKAFLNATISRNSIDVVALQEVWHPSEEMIFQGFSKPTMKLRSGQGGGGVAIAVSNKAKMVKCDQYLHDDLEAVWEKY